MFWLHASPLTGLVYVIACKYCGKQYFGETEKALRLTLAPEQPLARHLQEDQ